MQEPKGNDVSSTLANQTVHACGSPAETLGCAGISDVARLLQAQQEVPHWVVDDSGMIQALALRAAAKVGPRTQLLKSVFRATGTSPAGVACVWLIAASTAVADWLRAWSVSHRREPVRAVMIGMGAGQERAMLHTLDQEVGGAAGLVDERDPGSMGSLACPTLSRLLTQTWRAAIDVVARIGSASNPLIRDHRAYWLARAATRLARYEFAREWARSLPTTVRHVVFLAPSAVTFGIADALANSATTVAWWQHGCIRRSSMYPDVDCARMLTMPEATYLRSLGVCRSVEVARPQTCLTESYQPGPVVLFSSQYDTDAFCRSWHLDDLRSAFAWLRSRGFEVVVRPHPREGVEFWQQNFPDVPLQSRPERFLEHVVELRPRLVISWFSTALIEASLAGVPGMTLPCRPQVERADLVLDFDRLYLQWPRDERRLDDVLSTDESWCLYRDEQRSQLAGVG